MTRLKVVFEELVMELGNSQSIANNKWEKIFRAYTSPSRFYHNLTHLESILSELELVKAEINDWTSTLFSLFYHDIVYHSSRPDNEEKSAEFALDELVDLNLSAEQIEGVRQTILATKTHKVNAHRDRSIFLDADISILGASAEVYEIYAKNIRLEYLEYPSYVFNQGRVRVIEHFLNQASIYKTDFFKAKFEAQAKENLNQELAKLKQIGQPFKRTDTNEFVQYLEEDGNLSEFFYNAAKIIDQLKDCVKITYYPGWFDSGYYSFNYKGVVLHLEFDGMLGTILRTEPNATEDDQSKAEEVFLQLMEVRLTEEDLERTRKFYAQKNTPNIN